MILSTVAATSVHSHFDMRLMQRKSTGLPFVPTILEISGDDASALSGLTFRVTIVEHRMQTETQVLTEH
jgi:hypothetical protein